ncbi:MAG: Gfo/Idh/MocA family protein [Armatimonadota bacterium]
MNDELSRRELLRLGAAGVAAGMGERARAQEPIETVRLGFIGVGRRGTGLLRLALRFPGVEVPAICDIDESHLNRGVEMVREVRGNRPAGYSAGPTDYRRLLERDDTDAVLVATPMLLHARMSVDALRAGKHVLSEVAAATTMEECWELVETERETGKTYMLAENCCYFRRCMVLLNMVRQGVFGGLTYAECGYIHDCRALKFNADGSLTWRGELSRDYIGNLYPTHAIGPVAQWMDINRGDRLESLVALSSPQAGIYHYAAKRFGGEHAAARMKFAVGDTTTTLIRTAKGRLINLRYDTCSARPHPTTTHYALQGTTASYDSTDERIWIEGRSAKYAWEPLSQYEGEYEHDLWRRWAEEAKQSGHGGADFFVMREFVETMQTGRPSPINAADAAAWSCIIPLSAASIREGGAPQDIPDFARGAWETGG